MGRLMSFTAAGDCFITRRLACRDDAFEEVRSVLNKGEVRFTNLETTIRKKEGFPSAFSGGTWASAPPEVLQDIRDCGFNLLSIANNHTLDYSYGGLTATQNALDNAGFVYAGAGENLAEAGAPRYLDCPSGRVAVIAAVSTFHESWIAGEQRRDIAGRPGVNPLRYVTNYKIGREKMEQLRAIAECTQINAENNLSVREGFAVKPEDGVFVFGKHRFKESSEDGCETAVLKRDADRILDAVKEAQRQADYILISLHVHEMTGEDKADPPEFMVRFAKDCIDAGAHAVLGHGPHILRGIEIYKNRPIFYSLGNFIFQSETVERLPNEYYEKYGLGSGHNVADALDARTSGDTKGLGANPAVWESVIPYWSMQDGELKELVLYPVAMGFGMPRYTRGWPKISQDNGVLSRLADLSKTFSTKIAIEKSIGRINI